MLIGPEKLITTIVIETMKSNPEFKRIMAERAELVKQLKTIEQAKANGDSFTVLASSQSLAWKHAVTQLDALDAQN